MHVCTLQKPIKHFVIAGERSVLGSLSLKE